MTPGADTTNPNDRPAISERQEQAREAFYNESIAAVELHPGTQVVAIDGFLRALAALPTPEACDCAARVYGDNRDAHQLSCASRRKPDKFIDKAATDAIEASVEAVSAGMAKRFAPTLEAERSDFALTHPEVYATPEAERVEHCPQCGDTDPVRGHNCRPTTQPPSAGGKIVSPDEVPLSQYVDEPGDGPAVSVGVKTLADFQMVDELRRRGWHVRAAIGVEVRAQRAKETIRDALLDSQYLAGVGAGWNAAQSDDPEAALKALQDSRAGHLSGYAKAKRVLAALHPAQQSRDVDGAEAMQEACAKVAKNPGFVDATDTAWDHGFNYAKRHIAAAIRALPASTHLQPGPGTLYESGGSLKAGDRDAEIADLKQSVIAFAAPWAVTYARDYGLPDGHLHPGHYDLLAKCGARMDDFTRAALDLHTTEGEAR